MSSGTKAATVVRLSQPIMDGPREVSEVFLAGKPGQALWPLVARGDETEVDGLAVENLLAQRAGLSVSAVRRLAPVDLMTVMFTLFVPRLSADIVPLADGRKAKKG